jgi:hypothetical protein
VVSVLEEVLKKNYRFVMKLDPYQAKLIIAWIDKHLVNQDPRSTGKA